MSEEIRVDFVTDPDADPEEIDTLTRALRAEILQVDEVDTVERASAGAAPEGSKGLGLEAIGSLVVGVTPGLQAAVKVIEVVRSWLAGRSSTPPLQMTIGDKSITVVADKEQQDALVAAFVASLAGADAGGAATPATGAAPDTAG